MSVNSTVTTPYKVKSCLGKILGIGELIGKLQQDLKTSTLVSETYEGGETVYLDCQENIDEPYEILHQLFDGYMEAIETDLKTDASAGNLAGNMNANAAKLTANAGNLTANAGITASEQKGKPKDDAHTDQSVNTNGVDEECECTITESLIDQEDCECPIESYTDTGKHYNSAATIKGEDSRSKDGNKRKQIMELLKKKNLDLSLLKYTELCECCRKILHKDFDWNMLCDCKSDIMKTEIHKTPTKDEMTMFNADDLKPRNKRITDKNITVNDIRQIFHSSFSEDRREFRDKLRYELGQLVPDCDCERHCDYKELKNIDEVDENTPSFENFLNELMTILSPYDDASYNWNKNLCKICELCPTAE